MTATEAVPEGCVDNQNCPLFLNSGACWYALQNTVDAGVDVPLGLISLTLGGQRIEEFMSNVYVPRPADAARDASEPPRAPKTPPRNPAP